MTDSSKTVLLVEDDRFLSSLLKNRLTKEGVNVLYAEDGEVALQILRGQKVDLVLLDIILPKKSGFEVLEEIQQNPLLKNGPVIIISNLGQEGDMARGKELGAIEYFVKAQTSIDDLVKKIKEFIQA
jgi:two-component system alkaline phosphatase synthesis response regulator PhoP